MDGSPVRLLEMLSDRFGAFEAIATSSDRLARLDSDEQLPMEPIVAEAMLEFGEDLRMAAASVAERARAQGTCCDATSSLSVRQPGAHR